MNDKSGKGFCEICKKEVIWISYPDVHSNLTGSVHTGHSDKEIIDYFVRGIPQ